MFLVISYDIIEDERRAKIANVLKDYGIRVQYSVFECLIDEPLRQRMLKRLRKFINPEDDKLRIYQLCERCQKDIRTYGKGKITHDPEVYVI